MEEENLVTKAAENGAYLIERLKQIDGIENIRGRGLMIGFDVQDRLKDLRKILLQEQHVFTGEAKPTVVRLLPSLGITKAELDEFLEALQWAVTELRSLQPSKGNLQTAK
jgi:acetylornithine aminotransferase